jgi:hypothetical protein
LGVSAEPADWDRLQAQGATALKDRTECFRSHPLAVQEKVANMRLAVSEWLQQLPMKAGENVVRLL